LRKSLARLLSSLLAKISRQAALFAVIQMQRDFRVIQGSAIHKAERLVYPDAANQASIGFAESSAAELLEPALADAQPPRHLVFMHPMGKGMNDFVY